MGLRPSQVQVFTIRDSLQKISAHMISFLCLLAGLLSQLPATQRSPQETHGRKLSLGVSLQPFHTPGICTVGLDCT